MGAGEVFEDGNQIQEFIVVGVGEPAADGDGVLRVEDVGCWGVVDDYCFAEVTANLGEILDGLSVKDGGIRRSGEMRTLT